MGVGGFSRLAAERIDGEGRAQAAAHARRAERRVLALDRLLVGGDPVALLKAEPNLSRLLQLAQSLPDFDPAAFAKVSDILTSGESR